MFQRTRKHLKDIGLAIAILATGVWMARSLSDAPETTYPSSPSSYSFAAPVEAQWSTASTSGGVQRAGSGFRGVLLSPFSSAPTTAIANKGALYSNTADGKVYRSTGTSWVEVNSGGGAGSGIDADLCDGVDCLDPGDVTDDYVIYDNAGTLTGWVDKDNIGELNQAETASGLWNFTGGLNFDGASRFNASGALVPHTVSSTTKFTSLNADQLDGVGTVSQTNTNSSIAQRDATGILEGTLAVSGNDLVNVTYFNANAAGGAGKYYIDIDSNQGNTASADCASGYHMCHMYEWIGRTYDTGQNNSNEWDGIHWIDSFSSRTDEQQGDCSNWSSSSSSDHGMTVEMYFGGMTEVRFYDWAMSYTTHDCNDSRKTVCCED